MLQTRDALRTAFSGLSVHRNRSLLTILGVVVGITSVVLVMSLGKSAQQYIIGSIQRFGARNVFVLPGGQPEGLASAEATLLVDSLTQRDYEALQNRANVPQAVSVVPVVIGSVSVSFSSQSRAPILIGTTGDAERTLDLSVGRGRFFDAYDVADHARVAVIGDRLRRDLFGNADPIDQKIKVKNTLLRVVGVLSAQGSGFVDFDNAVFSPWNVVQSEILGTKYFQRFAVEAQSEQAIPLVKRDVAQTLRENHNITDPSKDDFTVHTQEDIAASIQTITAILTVLLTSIAAISLLVGGVGIMNIMYVSVTERTREIGLRKSLGATNRNVLVQFLIEALILTIGGGVVGVALGILLSFLLTLAAALFGGFDLPFVFSGSGIVLGIGVSSFIGLLFGVFPARAAARKSPIDALRE